MRYIGSLCKLIGYLKTVEFFTLKTSQCKKGDSKKYTLSVQCLHKSLFFYILKFNMNFQVTIIGPTQYIVPWKSLAGCRGATSSVLGSAGFNLGFEMWKSTTVFVPGVSCANTWEIGTTSTGVREFGTVASLTGNRYLWVRASITDNEALGESVSLEDVWKIWVETPLSGFQGHTMAYLMKG